MTGTMPGMRTDIRTSNMTADTLTDNMTDMHPQGTMTAIIMKQIIIAAGVLEEAVSTGMTGMP